MNLKKFFVIIFCLFISTILYAQEIKNSNDYVRIITIANKEFEGEIVDDTEDYLILKLENGKIFKFNKSNIVNQEKVERPKKKYPYVGIILGTPSGFAGVIGYNFNKFGIRFSGGYFPDIAGGQLNLVYLFMNKRKIEQGISILGGHMNLSPDIWTYTGLAYHLNIHGFFLETGLTIGKGTFPNPQLCFQIGYVYRFWN